MADIEDMLAGDDEENTDQPDPKRDNAAFAQMRKELKALKQEAEELRAFKAKAEEQSREAAVGDVLRQVGLKAKHAKWYPPDGDVSAEAIKVWAVAEELLEVEEGEEAPAPAPAQGTGFTPTVIGEGAPIGTKRYSFADWTELQRSDPARARQVWEKGLVEKLESPGGTVFAGRDR